VGGVPSVLTDETEGNMNTLNGKTHAIGGVRLNCICTWFTILDVCMFLFCSISTN